MGFFSLVKSKFKTLNLRLLSIQLPKEEQTEQTNIVTEIARSEQLLSALISVGEPFVFEVSVHHIGTSIHFYLSVPKNRLSFAKQQIQGIFPKARVEEVKDYNIFGPHSEISGGYATLKERFIVPLRTYEESGADTSAPLINNLSTLEEVGDGASLQILVRPAPDKAEGSIKLAINRLRRGESINAILKESFVKNIGKAVAGMDSVPKDESEKIIDEESINNLERKISKPLVEANVRIITSSESEDKSEDMLMAIVGSLSQLTAPRKNSLHIVKPDKIKKFIHKYSFREFDEKQSVILNLEEVASIFHLPTSTTDVPRIRWLGAKEATPPEKLSEITEGGIIIGDSIFRERKVPVKISDEDRRRHLYTIGQTGTGKTAMMKSMAAQDITNGKGLCIIDPNGDMVDDMLALIPEERINDVIVFDPGNLKRPVGLNMLEYDLDKPEQKTFIVNEMQSIFNRLFDPTSMGPMFEQLMRNALLLLMDDAKREPPTLIEVPRVFSDKEYRHRKLAQSTNAVVVDFWRKEAEKAGGEASLANMTPYITSKFNNFIANDYMRPIIGQTKSAFDFRDVMDNGKILMVKLSKGRIGDINANLLGMIITGKLLMAALGRENIPQEERKDFYFYIDEFQNFTTESIAVSLSEARKYRLNLTIAHQFIAQLTDEIRESVFGNVGSMMSFRVGAKDAEFLLKQFEPEFEMNDLINIENLHGIIRLLIKGQPSKPFNMKIRFTERGSPAIREKLVELSGLTYGKDLQEVERDILERLRK